MKPKRKKLPKLKTIDVRTLKKDQLGVDDKNSDDGSQISNLLGSQQDMSMINLETTPRGSQTSEKKRSSSHQIVE